LNPEPGTAQFRQEKVYTILRKPKHIERISSYFFYGKIYDPEYPAIIFSIN